MALDNALMFRRIEELATRDGLTGLFNRRHFMNLATHREGVDRHGATVMLDIDHFKKVNDTYGHSVGDQVISEVADRLAACLRSHDIICRFGGEEFAIMLPDATDEEADRVANRLRAAVADRPILTQAGPLQVTISVGVAPAPDDGPDNLQARLGEADNALYEAKRAGRNRVIHYGRS